MLRTGGTARNNATIAGNNLRISFRDPPSDSDGFTIDRPQWRGGTGADMPLDPLAKRFLAMMAAVSPRDRSRPTANDRRQALAKLMQLARADVTAMVGIDGVL